MPPGIRFRPPNVPLDPNVHWALLRAFGPSDAAGPAIQNHSEAVIVARRLSLTARIFGRCSRDILRGELATQYDEQAHAIGHGIAQHGFVPQSYPLLRLIADAIDLDMVGNRGRVLQALSWVQPDVSEQEVFALQELAESLTTGNVESAWANNGPVGRLLRHMVCGSLDERYCNGLKVYHAVHTLRTLGLAEFLREYSNATFALPKQDLSRIYGTPSHGHETRYKLLRPFDVTARILRMLPNAAVIARRQLAAIAKQQTSPGNRR